ncbi:MAG: OmpA family protein [Deltaproteobacteria bacterium]|nr:OmpA family protein [Deltaproteobacteria bacterium]
MATFTRHMVWIIFISFISTVALLGCGPTYPECDVDEDCHENEFCVNGMCQQCRDDGDCPTGQSCASGRCEPIENFCSTSSDCGEDEECRANRCVKKEQAATPYEPVETKTACSLRSVYFDFDSSDLKPQSKEELSQNAQCIREENAPSVHLTGLTDPRGTEEYNLALGERRASSAKKYLESLGIEANISHSSMGEEMAKGTDEATWATDRRVDFNKR